MRYKRALVFAICIVAALWFLLPHLSFSEIRTEELEVVSASYVRIGVDDSSKSLGLGQLWVEAKAVYRCKHGTFTDTDSENYNILRPYRGKRYLQRYTQVSWVDKTGKKSPLFVLHL